MYLMLQVVPDAKLTDIKFTPKDLDEASRRSTKCCSSLICIVAHEKIVLKKKSDDIAKEIEVIKTDCDELSMKCDSEMKAVGDALDLITKV